jgi:hypothetical protein
MPYDNPEFVAGDPTPEPDLTNMNASVNTITTVAAQLITRETEAIKAALANKAHAEVHAAVTRINSIASKLQALGASLRPIAAPIAEAEAKSKLRP